ncbi:MAG TPA: tail fiber domain-containing protein, partial [Panacibacter sp.]|nr:tail fiber domain-containing protein [Panacibacter sp.]
MAYNVTGSYNTAMGLYALSGGDNNYCTALGANAGSNAVVSLTNSTAIGNGATVDVSNKVRLGNTSVTSIGGQVGWTTFSDGRYKKNIKEDVKGLAFINSLKPVTYTVDVNGLNTYFDKNRVHDKKHDSTYEKMKNDMQPSTDEASKIVYNGFIAQDVEAAAEKLNYNFSGVDKPKTKDGLYGLRYADFVVPLVKAVQELSTANSVKDQTIQSLQATVDKQQQQINAILQKLNDLQAAQQACCNNVGSVQSSGSQAITLNGSDIASLQQNVPNPYSNTTVINFSLPKQYKSAQIVITDMSGQTIQQANVSGTNSLKIAAGSLASGNYKYSLIVDGKLISTKTMVVAK